MVLSILPLPPPRFQCLGRFLGRNCPDDACSTMDKADAYPLISQFQSAS